jgi:PBP1b-binding outer membrane lipoprotein LpoB
MKNKIIAVATLALVLIAGCKTAVDVAGQYSTAKESVSGGIDATTNGVTVGGDYQTGSTNIGGSVTIEKGN